MSRCALPIRDAKGASSPSEQSGTESPLQLDDTSADGRGRQVQLPRGTREAAGGDHGDEHVHQKEVVRMASHGGIGADEGLSSVGRAGMPDL